MYVFMYLDIHKQKHIHAYTHYTCTTHTHTHTHAHAHTHTRTHCVHCLQSSAEYTMTTEELGPDPISLNASTTTSYSR